MANKRKDGLPSNNIGGRKTKAEEMGLEKRMNDAFNAVTNGQVGHDGATEVLSLMWMKAIEQDYKAIEWIAHRYYGKEPKSIIKDVTVHSDVVSDAFEYFKETFGDG